jgi:HD-GYP domain-containing protein (c-di-GMP phosphodiesterase class II)
MESCGIPYSVSIGSAFGVSGQDGLKSLQLLAEERMYHQKLFSSPKVKDRIIDLAMAEVFRKSNRDITNSEQVGEWCRKIALALDFSEDRVAHVAMAGRLHDIGKIRLSSELLNKIEPLDEQDWRELRRHPEVGYAILSSVNAYAQLAEFVLYHHERWDGTGYPLGLSGEDIPLESRIIAVADAYQAMVTDRPNRKRMTPAEAKTEIARCAGTQFDPRIATCFVNMP